MAGDYSVFRANKAGSREKPIPRPRELPGRPAHGCEQDNRVILTANSGNNGTPSYDNGE
jgi:hypothetical protein